VNLYADVAVARHHAEESLAIKQTLDPSTAEIWKTYNILAQITDQQGHKEQSRAYRQKARQANSAFMGAQHKVKKHGLFIAGVVAAVFGNAEACRKLEVATQQDGAKNPGLVNAIRFILNGDRDEGSLVDPLDPEDSMIVSAILRGIADPSTLQALLGDE
jgi:hypothetical protein